MDSLSPFLDYLVSLYDPHGDLHAANVSDLATLLANDAGLAPNDIQHIELAARYHDIGKIAIPESIRRFPGIYTPLERLTMGKHPEIGAQLLQLLNFDPQVISIALAHHENYDGSGYPMMLHGENIPIGARIVRIVDSFDALTHSRGYRGACSQKRALEKLEETRHHYDPTLLDLFTEMIRTRWISDPWSH